MKVVGCRSRSRGWGGCGSLRTSHIKIGSATEMTELRTGKSQTQSCLLSTRHSSTITRTFLFYIFQITILHLQITITPLYLVMPIFSSLVLLS